MPKKERTGTLPGMKVPGHDEKLTAAALLVFAEKEEVGLVKKRVESAGAALLELMKRKKLSHYHDPDAKVRVEVARTKESVKVLRDKPAKARGRR